MKYRCLDCYHVWESKHDAGKCPACGSFYIEWVNYYGRKNGIDAPNQIGE